MLLLMMKGLLLLNVNNTVLLTPYSLLPTRGAAGGRGGGRGAEVAGRLALGP